MKKRVPWEYEESPLARLWRWKTAHFDAQIQSDGTRFSYNVADLTQGRRIPLQSSMTIDFESCEREILELIGKSYPLTLGYREYAGELATTFRINDGSTFNFGPFEGSRVVMKVKMEHGDEVLTGPIQVRNHDIEMISDSSGTIRIPPVFILSVTAEFSGGTKSDSNATRRTRTVSGEARRGCTGKPGFKSGTVEHPPRAPWCPVHRV